MRVSKTKKTSLVRRNLSPAFNQSFDIKLTEKLVATTFLTVQLKQARLFALKGLLELDVEDANSSLRSDPGQRHHRQLHVRPAERAEPVGEGREQQGDQAARQGEPQPPHPGCSHQQNIDPLRGGGPFTCFFLETFLFLLFPPKLFGANN